MLFCEYGTGNAWNLMLNLSDLLILMELKGFVIRHFCLDFSHSENTSFCENNGSLQFVQQLACYCHVPGYCAVFDVAVFYLQLTVLYWLMLAFCLCVSSIMYDHMHNMPTESTIILYLPCYLSIQFCGRRHVAADWRLNWLPRPLSDVSHCTRKKSVVGDCSIQRHCLKVVVEILAFVKLLVSVPLPWYTVMAH